MKITKNKRFTHILVATALSVLGDKLKIKKGIDNKTKIKRMLKP